MRTPGLAFVCILVAACGGDAFTAGIAPELDAGGVDAAPPPISDGGQDGDREIPTVPPDGGGAVEAAADAPKTPVDATTQLDAPTVDAGAVDANAPDVVGPIPETGPPPPPPDAGTPPDTAVPPPVDASSPPDVTQPPTDGAGEPPVCDLRPCHCSVPYAALCCNGPCPSGFEGLTCYCGQCLFPKMVSDAGQCE